MACVCAIGLENDQERLARFVLARWAQFLSAATVGLIMMRSWISAIRSMETGRFCRSHQLSNSIVQVTLNVTASSGGSQLFGFDRVEAISLACLSSSSRSTAAAPPVSSVDHSLR